MEFIKKNITLLVGIFIPILMILFVAGSIYLPGLFMQPKFNFLYVTSNDYSYYDQYSVHNGKLVRIEKQKPKGQAYLSKRKAKLYIHDTTTNKSREISFEEAQNLNLDSSAKSPDELEVVYGSNGNGFFPFLFWSERGHNALYLKGHNVSKKLNLKLGGYYYSNFHFIGWVIK